MSDVMLSNPFLRTTSLAMDFILAHATPSKHINGKHTIKVRAQTYTVEFGIFFNR